jgi:DNA-binding CsgD family transcriptional regulator
MRALHTTIRFGDRAHGGRLQELAKTLNTPMSETIAAHAHGLVVHDGVLLDAVADRFAEMGALGLAADATAQAARMHARTGNHGKEVAASTRAHWLASKCEIRTPAVNAAARPLPITDREREVAMLVAGGLSNRQIADRLWLSVRTVDGHLYRTFAKLGIERRDELVHLVNGARSTTSSNG